MLGLWDLRSPLQLTEMNVMLLFLFIKSVVSGERNKVALVGQRVFAHFRARH